MEKEIMSDIKAAANKCLFIMHKQFLVLKDPVLEIHKNDIDSAFKDIARYVFMNGDGAFDPELLRMVRNGMEQLQTDGYIIISDTQQ